tara:strand:- start:5370 stop:5939 length:570 start_codon:yes stop_codon:yes gene_type:complete
MDNIIKKLICTYENVLSDRICDNIINKFNNCNNINNIVNNDSNFSVYRIDSNSHDFDLWKDIDNVICEIVGKYTMIYSKYCADTIEQFSYYNFQDNGYTISKYYKNTGFQNFKHDFEWNDLGATMVSFVFFLNTIEEDGELEFINGVKILPKKGNLIFYPSTWDIMYKHNISKNFDKYTVKGKLYYGDK